MKKLLLALIMLGAITSLTPAYADECMECVTINLPGGGSYQICWPVC